MFSFKSSFLIAFKSKLSHITSQLSKVLKFWRNNVGSIEPVCFRKMHNFFIWLKVCCIPPNVAGSEKEAGCGLALVALKRTGCDMWQMECQASNITANVQSDYLLHGYMLPVFFTTDQLQCPPRSADIQPCRNKMLPQHVHITDWWYLIRVKKWKSVDFTR